MSSIRESVPYGMFVQKIECANHACKAYRSRPSQFRAKGGLTKQAIQRLTVGARIAIHTHSKTRDLIKLRHGLRNGPTTPCIR